MQSSRQAFFIKKSHIALLATLCALLWGSAYPGVKIGYELFAIAAPDVMGKLLFAGERFALAGILTLIIGWVLNRRVPLPSKKIFGGIVLLGLVQTTLQYIFFYIGLANTSGVKGAILNGTGAFVAVLLAHFLCKGERLTGRKTLGCLLGFSGVVLINLLGAGLETGFTFLGDGFILLAAVCFGAGSVLSKRVAQTGDSVVITGYQLLLGGGVLILIGILGGGSLEQVTWEGLALLLYLAALSAVAFTLWMLLLQYNEVGKIAVFNFLVPIFGTVLSAIFLGESFLEWKNLLALLLVCVGIYIVNAPQKNALSAAP